MTLEHSGLSATVFNRGLGWRKGLSAAHIRRQVPYAMLASLAGGGGLEQEGAGAADPGQAAAEARLNTLIDTLASRNTQDLQLYQMGALMQALDVACYRIMEAGQDAGWIEAEGRRGLRNCGYVGLPRTHKQTTSAVRRVEDVAARKQPGAPALETQQGDK